MCQRKPGLRCAQHTQNQIHILTAQRDQALNEKNTQQFNESNGSLAHAIFEYQLTKTGLKEMKDATTASGERTAKEMQDIRQARLQAVHTINQVVKPSTINEVPEQFRVQGTDSQYSKLDEDYRMACVSENDLRTRLTDNINTQGMSYSSTLLNKTSAAVKLSQQLKWYKNVIGIIKSECDRQHVGPDRVQYLSHAFAQASEQAKVQPKPTLEDIEFYAGILEPDSQGRVRFTNVTFASGGSAASGSAAYQATARLFSILDDETDADEFVHTYLRIHPFQDGNGRSAWLLRNWLKNSWSNPEPLPYYNFS